MILYPVSGFILGIVAGLITGWWYAPVAGFVIGILTVIALVWWESR